MPIGQPFVQLTEVDSTNNYAMGQVQAGLAGHGAAWFAHHQTAGRGQRGKTWLAEPGQNIVLSVVLQPAKLNTDRQFALSAAVALACLDLLLPYTRGNLAIKWPNDIYWRDRKAGGILIENVLQGRQWRFAIAGIGLNINQVVFNPAAANPVSLRQITGKQFNVVPLARQLCSCLQTRWEALSVDGPESTMQQYHEVMYRRGEVVAFTMEHATFEAEVLGVNERGELLVNAGSVMAIPAGQVQWVR